MARKEKVMKWTTFIFLLQGAILCSHCAANQQGPCTCPVDFPVALDHESTPETHREAVMEFMEVTRAKATSDALMLNLVQQRISKQPELAPIKHVLEEHVLKNMSFDSLKEGYVQIYMKHFTELEIKQISALQEVGISQLFAEKFPEITVEFADYASERLKAGAEEVNKIINDYLADQGSGTDAE